MRARTVVVVLSWALLAACRRDPQITSFSVAPQNACAGDLVMAAWVTTSDSTRISVSSGRAGPFTGAPTSDWGTDVESDEVFTLSAHIGDRSVAETRRVTVRTPLEFPEVIAVACDGSSPVFRTLLYEPAQYSDRFRTASIRNDSAQPVTVQHLTISRSLTPGEVVTESELGRVGFNGEWRITSALPPNACQQQSTGGGPPPPQLPRLRVHLVARCG